MTAMQSKRNKMSIGKAAIAVLLGVILIIQIFPLYYLFSYSLKSNEEIFLTNPIGLPKEWKWENYRLALSSGNVAQYLLNSVIVTLASEFFTLAAAVMASYALTRMRWKFREFTNSVLMLGITIPVHACLLPIFLILRKIGILNSRIALILPYTAFAVPMAILMMSGFMMNIPIEMEESAFMDGSGIYNTFFRIIIPLMRPGLATAAIFIFLQTWNELMFAEVFISSSALKTLPVGITLLSSDFGTNWGEIGAGMMIATLPTLIIYLFLSKNVQKSLVVGAVKG